MLTQAPIATSRELMGVLRELLATELGTFSTGATAIWVEPPFAPTRGSGLHCVIQRQPSMLSHKPNVGNQANQVYEWIVVLTADQSVESLSALDRAAQKIRSRFPRHREQVLPLVDGKLPQINFRIGYSRTVNVTPTQLY